MACFLLRETLSIAGMSTLQPQRKIGDTLTKGDAQVFFIVDEGVSLLNLSLMHIKKVT